MFIAIFSFETIFYFIVIFIFYRNMLDTVGRGCFFKLFKKSGGQQADQHDDEHQQIDREEAPDRFQHRVPKAAVHSFLDRHAPDIVSRWRRALCLSNQSRDQLRDVLNLLARCLDWPALSVAQRKRLLACEAFGQTRRLLEAVDLQPLTQQLLAEAEPLLAEGVAPLPWVTGQDLIDLGLKPSPLFGRLLDEIYDAQLEHRVTTREQAVELLRQRHAERPRGA